MDEKISLNELKRIVQNFCDERDWSQYHTPKDLAIGAVTEACELLEIFRFLNAKEEMAVLQSVDGRQAIADELADVLFFILRFSQMYGFDLSECLRQKILKNAVKYPVGSR